MHRHSRHVFYKQTQWIELGTRARHVPSDAVRVQLINKGCCTIDFIIQYPSAIAKDSKHKVGSKLPSIAESVVCLDPWSIGCVFQPLLDQTNQTPLFSSTRRPFDDGGGQTQISNTRAHTLCMHLLEDTIHTTSLPATPLLSPFHHLLHTRSLTHTPPHCTDHGHGDIQPVHRPNNTLWRRQLLPCACTTSSCK